MKVGITLPQFDADPDKALDAARRAEEAGLDGVFCFDHLWPMGQPGRPALSSAPLLGALAATTATLTLGSLVARVGLVPDDRLVAVLTGLSRLTGGRFIAGIGTGDRLSRAENDAFGVPYDHAAARQLRLETVAEAVAAAGTPVWVGGGRAGTVDAARQAGAAVNLWEGTEEQVAGLVSEGLEVTWGGPVPGSGAEMADRLGRLAAAGATWAVCAWPESIEDVAGAAATVRD